MVVENNKHNDKGLNGLIVLGPGEDTGLEIEIPRKPDGEIISE
jgi:hypothetical protein